MKKGVIHKIEFLQALLDQYLQQGIQVKDFCRPESQTTILHELAVYPNATTQIISQLIQAGCDPSNYKTQFHV